MKLLSFLRKYKTQSALRQYFFLVFLVLLTMAVITYIVTYSYFTQKFESVVISNSRYTLVQIQSAQEALLNEVEHSFTGILTDSTISQFPYLHEENDILGMQSVNSAISDIMARNPLILSLYVYYPEQQHILSSTHGYLSLDSFDDKNVINQLYIGQNIDQSIKFRKIRDPLSNHPIQVITYVEAMESAVLIINVNSSALLNQASGEVINRTNLTLVVENLLSGQLSCLSNSFPQSESLIIDTLSKLSLSTNTYYGDFCGEKCIIVTMKSPRYDWKYYCILPYSTLNEQVQDAIFIIFPICLGMIFIGAFIAFFTSKKLYTNIEEILSILSPGSKKIGNEVAVIKQEIHSIQDKNKSLQELLGQFQQHKYDIFCSQLLLEPQANLSPKRLEDYQLDLCTDGYFVVYLLTIDDPDLFAKTYSKQQQDMFFMYLDENIKELLASLHLRSFLVTISGSLAIVVNFEQLAATAYQTLAKSIYETACALSKNKFTMGVSSINKKLSNLHITYQQARTAASYQIVYGSGIILYDNIDSQKVSDFEYPLSIEQNLLEGLRLNSASQIQTALEEFGEYFYDNLPHEIEVIKNSYVRLLLDILQNLYKTGANTSAFEGGIHHTFAQIHSMNTISQMSEAIGEFLSTLLADNASHSSIKNSEILEKVKAYIADNPEKDLSIETLADRFFLSTSYLRKLFKTLYNTSIKRYVLDVRMQKARQLLENPKLKIVDIAQATGYLTTQSLCHGI